MYLKIELAANEINFIYKIILKIITISNTIIALVTSSNNILKVIIGSNSLIRKLLVVLLYYSKGNC